MIRRFLISVLLLAVVCMTACKCTAEKGAVANVQKTHDAVSKKFLKYVDADASLSDADKKDWHSLVESDQRNIDALKKSVGD